MDAIQSTTPTGQNSTSASSTALSQLSEDYTKFLTLLTAQIQNQDPLSPMDSTEFVSQLAQLSQVEQAVQTNSNLESLNARVASLEGVAGIDMVGRDIVFGSNLVEHTADGNRTFYQLPTDATEVVAEITDPKGHLVRTLNNLQGDAGKELAIGWDGKDDAGQDVLLGNYYVSIQATDAEGESIPVSIYRTASVDEALFEQGELYYNVSGGEILPSDGVLGVR